MTTIVAVELGGTGANNTADARAALGVASSTVSNAAYSQANSAYGQANLAYTAANNAYTQANNSYGQANSAYAQANLGYTQANTATTNAGNAHNQANNAYAQANLAYTQANNAVLRTGDTMTGRLGISNTTNNVVTSGIILTGNRNYVAGDNGGIQIFATGSGGTIGTHDYGAIKFYARGFTGASDGGGGIVSLHVGGSSSNPTSNGMFLQADGGLELAQNIKFYTGTSAERMRIDVSGNVGIGINSPTAKLHLYGAGSTASNPSTSTLLGATLALQDSGGNSGNGGMVMFGASQGFFAAIKGFITEGGANTQGDIIFATRNGSTDAALTERIRITSSGNVGVGTSAPASRLDVYTATASGGHSPLFFSANNSVSAKTNYVQLGFTVEQGLAGSETGGYSVKALRNNSLINLCTYDGAATVQAWKFFTEGSERMRIDSSGNIGIGTNNPLRRLDIAGGGFAFTEAGGSSRTIHWGDTTNIYPVTISGNATSGNCFLAFNTNTFGNGGAERMRVTSAGNVGIGTTVPGTRLEVYVPGGGPIIRAASDATGGGADNGFHIGLDGSAGAYLSQNENAPLYFYTNGSERMRIEASGTGPSIRVATGGYNWLNLVSGYTGNMSIGINDYGGSGALGIYQYNASGTYVRTALTLDSSGNFGFGTASPNGRVGILVPDASTNGLSIQQAGTTARTINEFRNTGTNGSQLSIRTHGGSYSETLLGVSMSGTTALVAGPGDLVIGTVNANFLAFGTSNAERVRIPSGGGLSVGTTASPGAGAIFATGEITAFYSDDRLKNRIGNIDDALSKVLTLNGFYYEPNETAMDLGYEKKKQVGVSAQEVQEVLPEVVVAAPIDDKYMTVHYHKLVPLLIEAIKELNTKIEDMQKIIESKS